MSSRIAVAATAPFGAVVLEGLARRFEVELLLTRPDRPRGRGRRVQPSPAKAVADRLGLRVEQPERLESLPGDAPTVIVAGYGVLIPSALLEERLWLNVHPSLLPRWRGAAPIERALIAGDEQTGVTIHRTTAQLDAGPIAAQQVLPIGADDDAGTLFARAAELAVELVGRILPHPSFYPQPLEGVTYAEKIGPEDRELDWSLPAPETVNRVRALSPHIGARACVRGRPALVWKARLVGEGAALVEGGVELLELQPAGRRRMSGAEFLRGVR